MLWLVTGYSSHSDGIAYVVEAETEEGAYKEVARLRKMLHLRIDKTAEPRSVAEGVGLDDHDEFSSFPVYDILIWDKSSIPTYEDVEFWADKGFRGFNVIATPLRTGENLEEIVQW
jgi:hypothetical protein